MERYEILWDTGDIVGLSFATEEDAETYLRETCGAPDDLTGTALEREAGATIRLVQDDDQDDDADDAWDEIIQAEADAHGLPETAVSDAIRRHALRVFDASQFAYAW